MQPLEPLAAIGIAVRGLREQQMHTGHRRSFGLFNPTPATMGIAADALVAAFNVQLAAWGHSPFAGEVEQQLIRAFADRFGCDSLHADGTFTSGGNEANHTALICALTNAFPAFSRSGLRGLERQPVLYASTESHYSLVKAARACGLGTDALQLIPTDAPLRMDVAALHESIVRDRAVGPIGQAMPIVVHTNAWCQGIGEGRDGTIGLCKSGWLAFCGGKSLACLHGVSWLSECCPDRLCGRMSCDGGIGDGAELAEHVGRQIRHEHEGDRWAKAIRRFDAVVEADVQLRSDEHSKHLYCGFGCCAYDGHCPSLLIHLEHTSRQMVTGTMAPLADHVGRYAVTILPRSPTSHFVIP